MRVPALVAKTMPLARRPEAYCFCSVVAQARQHDGVDLDRPAAVALRRSDEASLVGALDANGAGVPVDVAPLESDELTEAHAGSQEHLCHRAIPVGRSIEVGARLGGAERADRRLLVRQLQRLVAVDARGGIARDKPFAQGTRHDLAQRHQRVIDRLGGERALAIELADVSLDSLASNLAQLEAAERGAQPDVEMLLVRLDRPGLDAMLARLEPASLRRRRTFPSKSRAGHRQRPALVAAESVRPRLHDACLGNSFSAPPHRWCRSGSSGSPRSSAPTSRACSSARPFTGCSSSSPCTCRRVLGYLPLKAGFAWLALSMTALVTSLGGAQPVTLVGPRRPLVAGLAVAAAGTWLLARVPADASYIRDLLPALTVSGIGVRLAVVTMSTGALEGVEEGHCRRRLRRQR